MMIKENMLSCLDRSRLSEFIPNETSWQQKKLWSLIVFRQHSIVLHRYKLLFLLIKQKNDTCVNFFIDKTQKRAMLCVERGC